MSDKDKKQNNGGFEGGKKNRNSRFAKCMRCQRRVKEEELFEWLCAECNEKVVSQNPQHRVPTKFYNTKVKK